MQKNTEYQNINLLVTIDKNYLSPLLTMLRSYIETNGDIPTTLYVAHSILDEEDIARIEAVAEGSLVQVRDIRITERWFTDIPVLERLPEESFYRLLAFHYLPRELDKCLYLDPDILIRKPLLPLYIEELSAYYIAAAGHLHGFRNDFNKKRLGLKEQSRYINSGVMLMNLAAIRRDFSLESVLTVLAENVRGLLMGDQDMVNLLFGRATLFIDEGIYNLDERTFRYLAEKEKWTLATVKERTAIIHYNGKCKPWLAGYEGVLDLFYPDVKEKGPKPSGVARKHVKSFFRITRLSKQQYIAVGGIAFFTLLLILSYVFLGQELLDILREPTAFRAWLDGFGAFDELVFILIRSAQTVIKFIPAEPLEIGAGFAWGAVPGMIYCLIGNLIGTLIIFALTKKFGKRVLALFLPEKSIRTFTELLSGEKIYALLFFLYLIPGTPKDGFTYVVGLLPVKLVPFLVITFIARIPSVISSTICGSALAEQQYLFSALVFIATILLALIGGAVYAAVVKRRKRKAN